MFVRRELGASARDRRSVTHARMMEWFEKRRARLVARGGRAFEFVPAPVLVDAGGRDRVLHLQQTCSGFEVLGGSVLITASPRTRVWTAWARTAAVSKSTDIVPRFDLREALEVALDAAFQRHADEVRARGREGRGWENAAVVARLEGVTRPAVCRADGIEAPIIARLVLLPTGKSIRLAWQFEIDVPEIPFHETVFVSASTPHPGVVLSTLDRSPRATRATAFLLGPDEGDATSLDLPPSAASYGVSLGDGGAGFPAAWLGADLTNGNNAMAFANALVRATRSADGTFEFAPADATRIDSAVVNLFVHCNRLHDLFWLLGFREAEGNFQMHNGGPSGLGGDPLRAHVIDGPVSGGATMSRSRDGTPSILVAGRDATGARHAAFDADVIFHEYTHGVTHRMVGGRFNGTVLTQPQALGMSEGWSDYFAISFLNAGRARPRDVFATYFSGRPSGLRSAPYDERFSAHATYGTLARPGHGEAHEAGEVWCAALLDTERRIAVELPRERAGAICRRAVFDSLRRVPAEPHFLQGRDAVTSSFEALAADGLITSQEATLAGASLAGAFAALGMGPNAASPHLDFSGIVEDRTTTP